MSELKNAQELIETKNLNVISGFNSFIYGHGEPKHKDCPNFKEKLQGYKIAEEMAREEGIPFTYRFRCKCGGYQFLDGKSWVCDSCGKRNVEEYWWQIQVEKDGDEYCCHGLDFINFQESNNYAFGKTIYEAIKNYEIQMRKLLKYSELKE